MLLAEFLLARIAEDQDAWRWFAADGDGTWGPHGRRHMAECGAKRQIVEDEPLRLARDRHSHWERTLRILATVYSDHPDYHDEWKP